MSDFQARVREIRQKIRERTQRDGVDPLFSEILNLIEMHVDFVMENGCAVVEHVRPGEHLHCNLTMAEMVMKSRDKGPNVENEEAAK